MQCFFTAIWPNLGLEDKQGPLMENINNPITFPRQGRHSQFKILDYVSLFAHRLAVGLNFQRLFLRPTLVRDDLRLDLDKSNYFYHFVPL